ncbi:hypothetical protein QBC38DRAFT_285763 [Podospora fimiseda]|uniref:3-beta hydroxysteroid dehydrogenase/isomerase domain-containing protein n=1 Tax=Podospora fimiseda TaxID=252190 RepID=A0AAN7BKA8_9PEZI|nr:hypothetical protein QBC38DRAFT_285763 [Podospora fimiseda]
MSVYWPLLGALVTSLMTLLYLVRINFLLTRVPENLQHISGSPWTAEQLKSMYRQLQLHPIDYSNQIPSKLNRRYIVTGGNGLVGGFIVLQLLARGTPPANIRILDIRKPERTDMTTGLAKEIEFIPTDITSAASVDAAFNKPWPGSLSKLPVTVFHTAAVILASDRSRYLYDFPEKVNVKGTANVLAAARAAGADIFSSTSSASISIRPVNPFVSFWAKEPENYWQILDERDFWKPCRPYHEFFGNYPASKAVAERLVCDANCPSFRTGCIRPANGVYGNPTDNTVGGPLSKTIFPTWVPHIIQSFVHGANVAIAHLHHEAVLVNKNAPQSGRPFVVTDPNPPISYSDLYQTVSVLSIHRFRTITLPPVLILVLSHLVEWYILLPYRLPYLRGILPKTTGDLRHLQPGLFSICTHLTASDGDARKPVAEGGLGYHGVLTTMEGMVLELLEWNREHEGEESETGGKEKKRYTTSISLAEQLRQILPSGNI